MQNKVSPQKKLYFLQFGQMVQHTATDLNEAEIVVCA